MSYEFRIILVILAIVIPTCQFEDLVGNEVLAGAVALYNGTHHVLGHILIVGQELLGVLGQAIASVTEARVVVMGADAGIEADALNDILGFKPLGFRVGIEFIEE